MPWAKLDDELHLNRKIAALSSDAFRLWVLSISWSSAERKGGKVPEDALPFVWPTATPRTRQKAASELLASGRWEQNGAGWVIHDFLKYNPPAEEENPNKASEAGTRAAHIRWHQKRDKVEPDCELCDLDAIALPPHSERNPNAMRKNAFPSPIPDPVPPVEDSSRELNVDALEVSLAPLARKVKPRNWVWDGFSSAFGEPSNESLAALRGKLVKQITQSIANETGQSQSEVRANPASCDEVIRRAQTWPLHWPEIGLTDTGLARRWDEMRRLPLKVSKKEMENAKKNFAMERRSERLREMGP